MYNACQHYRAMQQSAGSYLRIPTRTRPVLCALCPNATQPATPISQNGQKAVAALSQAFKTMRSSMARAAGGRPQPPQSGKTHVVVMLSSPKPQVPKPCCTGGGAGHTDREALPALPECEDGQALATFRRMRTLICFRGAQLCRAQKWRQCAADGCTIWVCPASGKAFMTDAKSVLEAHACRSLARSDSPTAHGVGSGRARAADPCCT
jgi:hypothetical protein